MTAADPATVWVMLFSSRVYRRAVFLTPENTRNPSSAAAMLQLSRNPILRPV